MSEFYTSAVLVSTYGCRISRVKITGEMRWFSIVAVCVCVCVWPPCCQRRHADWRKDDGHLRTAMYRTDDCAALLIAIAAGRHCSASTMSYHSSASLAAYLLSLVSTQSVSGRSGPPHNPSLYRSRELTPQAT